MQHFMCGSPLSFVRPRRGPLVGFLKSPKPRSSLPHFIRTSMRPRRIRSCGRNFLHLVRSELMKMSQFLDQAPTLLERSSLCSPTTGHRSRSRVLSSQEPSSMSLRLAYNTQTPDRLHFALEPPLRFCVGLVCSWLHCQYEMTSRTQTIVHIVLFSSVWVSLSAHKIPTIPCVYHERMVTVWAQTPLSTLSFLI